MTNIRNTPPVDFDQVFNKEKGAIIARRKKINPEYESQEPENLFGIALSGGGIRSATINLGVLKILNRCGILCMADYLSTVSGGGFIGGYIHSKLRGNGSQKGSFDQLFIDNDLEYLKKFGYYLAPGGRVTKFCNYIRLAGAFLASTLMNLTWIISLVLSFLLLVQVILGLTCKNWFSFGIAVGVVAAIILAIHFFLHGLRHYKLWSSNILNIIEGLLLVAGAIFGAYVLTAHISRISPWLNFPLVSSIFFILGWFSNPNILGFHRFYRDRLATAYLKAAGQGDGALKLAELNLGENGSDWGAAPYSLINTCINLLNEKDETFKGQKTCDYFLLSPLFCGSKLTKYIDTRSWGYSKMTLSTATAISGAAVSPNMGLRTKKILAFFMTPLNLRLSYWALNPQVKLYSFFSNLTWWPYYHLAELLSKTDTKKRRVNLSDGGHIENLGIYELLRRKCRLIIAIDASADPNYGFSDLQNLVMRARNELGIEIKFREGQDPEDIIRPMPSKGFSRSHFVVADINELQGPGGGTSTYNGLLVYMKSSMKATKTFKVVDSRSFGYKMYHPAFPHESTADQFFDRDQWEAYYELGRFMAGDLLRIDVTDENKINCDDCTAKNINKLYMQLDAIKTKKDLACYQEIKL